MQKQNILLVAAIAAFCVLSNTSHSQTIDPNAVDGQIHLKISTDPGFSLDGYTGGNLAFDALFSVAGLDSIFKPFPLPGTELDSIYRVVFPNAAQVNTLLTALDALPYVEFAEKNPLAFEFETPNDLQQNQWYLQTVEAELGWNYTTGSSDVVVAVLDDAIAVDHQDLTANIYVNQTEQNGLPFVDDDLNGKPDDVNGFDVADNDSDPAPPSNASGNNDGFTHGTHVAGLVSAATNNGLGIASLGYNTTILPVKIGRDSDGALSGFTDGMYYAIRSGVDVINMSFGTTTDVATVRSLVVQASAAGILMIAAAGNDGDQTLHYPAAYPEVMSVGATDENDVRSSFSNYGSTIDVMAPGSNIYSTLPEGNNTYGNKNGTSMATPLVSGLAALVKAQFPSLTATQIQSRIEQACDDISSQNPGMNGMLGAGRINAFSTLGNVGVVDVSNRDFTIYPNPTNRFLHFDVGEGTPEFVQIFDVSGRMVFSNDFVRTIDLSFLQSGVYHVVLRLDDVNLSSKLILQ